MKYKDYYKILGVARGVGDDEIKKNYRKLARKYHPDVSKEANAKEKFQEVSEAYETLRDKEKRAAYDRTCTASTSASCSSRWESSGAHSAARSGLSPAKTTKCR